MTQAQTTSKELKHGLLLPSMPPVADTDSLIEYAVAAEQAGWDGVLLGDHLIYPYEASDPEEVVGMFDPWITLAGIATRTDDISLCTWITPVPRRQPWQLARDLATVDHLSDGRVILGAGLGTPPDFNKFGRTDDLATLGDRYDEALDVITGLWSGESFTYDGEHFTVDEATVLPTPIQEPRIPIVMGCWWPNKKPFQRAARWDGIMPFVPSFYGEEGVHGEERTGTPEEEVREMLTYYRSLTDDPGEIFLPIDYPTIQSDFLEVCKDVGATWAITSCVDPSASHNVDLTLDRVREGPPK